MQGTLELSSVKPNIAAALFLCVSLVWLPICGDDDQPHLSSKDLHKGDPLSWEGVLDPARQSNENVQHTFMV